VRLAYCLPYVGAYFNFLLFDEQDLAGWQSGAFWADYTPKDSFDAFRRAFHDASAGSVDCAHLKGGAAPTMFTPLRTVELERVAWAPAAEFNSRNDLWRFRVETGENARYRSTLYRVGGKQARVPVWSVDGVLRQGYFSTVEFPRKRLTPGRYQIETELWAAGNATRQAVRTGPIFTVKERLRHVTRPKSAAVRERSRVVRSVVLSSVSVPSMHSLTRAAFARRAAPVTTRSAPPRIIDVERPIETQILAEINRIRVAHKLSRVRSSAALARAADVHARAVALSGEFGHEWPDGRPFARWIADFYAIGTFRHLSVGENLYWSAGRVTAAETVRAWLASASHRRIVLAPAWRDLGIGVVVANQTRGVRATSTYNVVAAEFGART